MASPIILSPYSGFMRGWLMVLIGILVMGMGAAYARADETIWSAVVFGTNRSSAGSALPLEPLVPEFRRLFGYKSFEILGENTQKVREGTDSWLVPSKGFYLKASDLRPTEGGYLLKLTLYQQKRILLEADVKLGRKSPLVIRGPDWGDGTILVVLVNKR